LTIAALLGLACLLGGCVGGPDAKSVLTPSPSDLTTGSIPTPAPLSSDDTSDRQVVGAAVTASASADAKGDPIPWANPSTGTTGVISQVSQSEVAGQTCKIFETSRHSYSGIELYVGQTCLGPDGAWQMIEFRPKRAMNAAAEPDVPPSDNG